MSESGDAAAKRPGAAMAEAAPAEHNKSYLGQWLNTETASSAAWGLWESVKNNPKVVEAQQQAQQAWQQYDSDAVRSKLAELGKSATEYIDEADRRLETLEVGAVSYLQQRSSEIVERVRQAAAVPEREGEVLFSGPERAPVSRLDAELQQLHASPDRVRAKTDAPAARVPAADTADWLAQSPELTKLHDQLAPELGEPEFWNRYCALRDELVQQDRRRKMLIESQSEDKFEGWGSSDEDEDEGAGETASSGAAASSDAAAASTAAPATAAPATAQTKKNDDKKKPAGKPREPIDEEASDIDWE